MIRHVLSKLPRNYIGIYLDIQSAENLHDFMNIMATSMIRAVPEKSRPGKLIWNFIKTFRPVITFDQITGLPQIMIDSHKGKAEPDIETCLRFLEDQPFRIVIAIDEFQQILRFPEKKEIISSLWQIEASLLIKEAEPVFFSYRELLTHPQWMLLLVYKDFDPDGQSFHSVNDLLFKHWVSKQ